jgi:bifunctional non-homologous end joining protein LigD
MRLPTGVAPANIEQLLPDAVCPSKGKLIEYWKKVHKPALKYLARRPLRLVRHVHPITFYHKDKLPLVPTTVHRLPIVRRGGGPGVRVWIDDLDGLLGLVEMDAVEVHPWHATIDDIEHPDQLAINLNPRKGTSYAFVCEKALLLRDLLKQAGFRGAWPKTTGANELHIIAAIARGRSHEQVRAECKALAQKLIAFDSRCTLNSKDDRPGQLLVDCLRNGFNASSIGVFSPRSVKGHPIAMKVSWKQIEVLVAPETFTMGTPNGPPTRRR